ncbi:MAG: regulator of sigma E protease [Candidatus Paceibacteria bacterium]|jgi:regulator of sigma E protease
MSVFLFLVVLFVLILVHEWGHFIVAKKTGMRVDEFGIGFPPKLFGIKKGETEYTFNALPIGGFVRIFGENGEQPISPVESEANDRRSEATAEAGEGGTKFVLQSTSNPASATSQYKPDPRAFNNRPKWAQALVLIAGVVMNILFAWLLFSVTYMVGVPTAIEESAAGPDSQLLITGTLPDSPASAIPAGSQIISVTAGGGTLDTPTPTTFSEFVTTVAPAELDVTYQLGGEVDTVAVTPTQGIITDEPDRYAVGASLVLIEIEKQPFFTAIANGFSSTVGGLQAITVGLFTLIGQSFSGTADYTQVAGPIGIVGMVGDAAAFGFTALLTFTAVISLNLAVINLLPFPALDGGRLVFVAIETVTGKDIPPQWAGRINLVGFALLMLLMVAVTYNDILNLL